MLVGPPRDICGRSLACNISLVWVVLVVQHALRGHLGPDLELSHAAVRMSLLMEKIQEVPGYCLQGPLASAILRHH